MLKQFLLTVIFVFALASLLANRSQLVTLGEQLPLWRVSNEVGVGQPAPNQYAPPTRCYAQGIVEGLGDETELSFELPGRITVLNCSDERSTPQTVKRGDILARIDHSLWLQKVRQAEAKLAKARASQMKLIEGASMAEREEAKANARAAAAIVRAAFDTYTRTKTLAAENIVPEQDLDDAVAGYRSAHAKWKACKARVAQLEDAPREFEIEAAEAEIRLAESQLQQARTMLHKTVLRAPCDATVLSVDGEVGELTGPEAEKPVIRLVDSSQLRVRAYVDELDALNIEQGQRVQTTTDSLPSVAFTGRVESCLASMQPKTEIRHSPTEKYDTKVREVVIGLDIDQPQLEKLVIGLPVDVLIDKSPANPGILRRNSDQRDKRTIANVDRAERASDAGRSSAPWLVSSNR